MKQLEILGRTTLALIFTSTVLAAIVIVEWLNPLQLEDFDAPVIDGSEVAMPDLIDSSYLPPNLGELDEMFERPLFFSDRRMPEPPKPVAVAAAPPTPLRLKLEGVAITTEARVAVLRDLENNQLVQLAEGMSHKSWTLDSVKANGAIFTRGPQTSELMLDPGPGQSRR